MSEANRSLRRSRWMKGILLAIAGTLVVLFMLLAAAPTLVNLGLGQGIIRSAIERQVNGTVDFDAVRLSWLGAQRIKGLTITDEGGRDAADLDVDLNAGLLALLRGSFGSLTIDVSGRIDGELRDDGSFSFADLLARDDAPASTEPPRLGAINLRLNAMRLSIEDVRDQRLWVVGPADGVIALVPGGTSNVRLRGPVTVGDDVGEIDIEAVADGIIDADGALAPSGASIRSMASLTNVPAPRTPQVRRLDVLRVELISEDLTRQATIIVRLEALREDGETGELDVRLRADAPVTSDGQVRLGVDGLKGTVDGQGVPTSLLAPLVAGTGLDPARDIGPTLDVHAEFTGDVAGVVRLNLDAAHVDLRAAGVIDPRDGSMNGDLLRVQARVQPELVAAVSDWRLEAPADVTLELSSYTIPAVGPDGRLLREDLQAAGTLTLNGPASLVSAADGAAWLDVETLRAHFDSRANVPPTLDGVARWDGSLAFEGTAHEGLLRRATGLPADGPSRIALELPQIALPSPLAQGPYPIAAVGLRGELTMEGPLRLLEITASPETGDLEYARLSFDADALGTELRLRGSAGVLGGTLTIDERVTGLVDDEGRLPAADAIPVGLVELRGVSPETLTLLLPEQADLIRASASGIVSARVITSLTEAGPQVRGFVFGGGIEAAITAIRLAEGLRVEQGRASLVLTSRLLEALQAPADEVTRLRKSADVTIELQPFLLSGSPPLDYRQPDAPIEARLTAGELVLEQVPSLASALSVRGLEGQVIVRAPFDRPEVEVVGAAELRNPDEETTIADIDVDLAMRPRGEGYRPEGEVELTGLDVAQIEHLLGVPPGRITDWVGPYGRLRAELTENPASYDAKIYAELDQLRGRITGSRVGEMLTMTAEDLRVTLRRQMLERLLNPETGPAPAPMPFASRVAPDAKRRLQVGRDVPLNVTFEQFRLPLALLAGEPFDPAAVDLDVQVRAGAIALIDETGARSTLSDLRLWARSDDLRHGLEVRVVGTADPQDGAPAAPVNGADEQAPDHRGLRIDVVSKLTELVGPDSMLRPEQASLQVTAELTQAPTGLADALLGARGLLAAAVGPRMDASITARNLSPRTGTLEGRIDTPNGWLEARAAGAEEALRISGDDALRAELAITAPLRERLLRKIHPIFADVRTVEERVRLSVSNAVLPADGDVSRLQADLELVVGNVEIDTGSALLLLLELSHASHTDSVAGSIQDVKASIENGVIKYERFRVQLGKVMLDYSGTVNLNTGMVDLRTEVPLDALAQSSREVRELRDKLRQVPLFGDITDSIAVPILTRGSLDAPEQSLDPTFNVEKAIKSIFDDDRPRRNILDELLKPRGRP